jgi:hypothetical protein
MLKLRGGQLGQWTTILQAISSNENLARVGFNNGLDACIYLNQGTVHVSTKPMSTAMEAILGAVHLDGGEEALVQVMERLGLSHALLTLAVMSKQIPCSYFYFKNGVSDTTYPLTCVLVGTPSIRYASMEASLIRHLGFGHNGAA